jgi:hypothetical protein
MAIADGRVGVLSMSKLKFPVNFLEVREKRRPLLKGMKFLHEEKIEVSTLSKEQPSLSTKELLQLLIRDLTQQVQKAQPRVCIKMHVLHPSGLQAVKLKVV